MRIQIWDGKEWVDKFSAKEIEVKSIQKALEEGGFRVLVVGDGQLARGRSNLDNNIIKALLEE